MDEKYGVFMDKLKELVPFAKERGAGADIGYDQ